MEASAQLDESAYCRNSQDAWASFLEARFDAHGRTAGSSGRAARLRMAELELESLRTYTALSKRRRNAVTACGSVPPEVLAIIFAFAQDIWEPECIRPDTINKKAKPSYRMGWMSVLHVVYSWRKTALDNPQLWTRLECLDIHPQFMPRTLLNSRHMPLRVHVRDGDASGFLDIAAPPLAVVHGWLCTPVIKRTEKLVIAARHGIFESWMAALNAPAPIMTELELGVVCQRNQPFHLQNALFANQALPKLTTLSLTGCLPGWDSHLFSSNLTSLRLSLAHIDFDAGMNHHDFLPTTSIFRQLLAPMKSLAELYLHNFFPRDDSSHEAPLALPSTLKTFECTCDEWDAFNEYHQNLWPCIEIPRDAVVVFDIQIEAFEELVDGIAGDLFMPLLAMNNREHPAQELYLSAHAISLRYSSQKRQGWTWQWPDEDSTSDRDALAYDRESGSRHVIAWTPMCDNVPQLPLETLQAVYFCSDAMHHYASPAKWLDVFGRAREVERLSIPYLNSLNLLSAMVPQGDEDLHSLFPSLKVLIIHTGSLEEEKASAYHAAVDLSLVHLLEMRGQAGGPIRELLVHRSMVSWEIWDRVRESTSVSFFGQ
ncbi:unnamed protein product [Peniophora sp. CBMAI 1063]|nr:unnamed protein product [Peniophora sp. CBMAI 1063]